ncbi:unnamed protein product [Bursaphelenchus okinawaensis]|uniref:DNA replication complex GINS protein PSF3 n=1 Tax=Bursaphelenchus okinawaensis TaxID=465554 RepID=A0A811LF54_9BILA|nr:unnamed protein product [Bursaphelenchus okinawaensis]CAG9121890.1 unnamed protein product [Bursaphelenchus okinawaensis]
MGTNSIRNESNAMYTRWKLDGTVWDEEEYMDVDDIIASQANVQCLLRPQIAKEVLPYAQLHSSTTIPPRGIKGNIGVWLLKNLMYGELIVPSTYTSAARQILHAGAWVLNFDTDKRYFYELGINLAEVLNNDDRCKPAQEMIKMLRDTYMARQGKIYPLTIDKESRPTKMSQLEARLFFKGQYSEARMKEWWIGVAKEKRTTKKRFKR